MKNGYTNKFRQAEKMLNQYLSFKRYYFSLCMNLIFFIQLISSKFYARILILSNLTIRFNLRTLQMVEYCEE